MTTRKCAMHVDSFSVGLDELPRRKQRDTEAVLAVLRKSRRFSVFEATASGEIAATMVRLTKSGVVQTDDRFGYPWVRVVAINGVPLWAED